MSASPADRSSWQQIADDLRGRIDAGEYAAGDRVPPRRELMACYGVADRTVGRALHQLRDEGYLLGRSKVSWVIRGRRQLVRSTRNRLSGSERVAGRGTFVTDCRAAGLTPAVSTEIRIEAAGESVAAALGIDAGDEVCVRERIMRGDGEVLQLATSYLPRPLTAGPAGEQEHTGPGGMAEHLEETGHRPTRHREQVSIGRASEREAAVMALNLGEPLLRVRRTTWAGDRVVQVDDIVITGNRCELVYELPAE